MTGAEGRNRWRRESINGAFAASGASPVPEPLESQWIEAIHRPTVHAGIGSGTINCHSRVAGRQGYNLSKNVRGKYGECHRNYTDKWPAKTSPTHTSGVLHTADPFLGWLYDYSDLEFGCSQGFFSKFSRFLLVFLVHRKLRSFRSLIVYLTATFHHFPRSRRGMYGADGAQPFKAGGAAREILSFDCTCVLYHRLRGLALSFCCSSVPH